MRARGAILLFALLLAAAHARAQGTAAPGAPAWSRLTFPGEEFSVEWPDMPFVYETNRRVRNRKDEYEKFIYFGTYADGVVYRLTSFHRPRAHETLGDFIALSPNRELLRTAALREVTAGGLPAVEFEFDTPFTGMARVFRSPNYVYLLEAYSIDGRREGIARFLDSLALGPNPQGRAIVDTPVTTVAAAPPAAGGGDGKGRPAEAVGGPFRVGEVAKRAVIMFKMEPAYTEEARRDTVQGLVRLRAVLSSTGKVTDIEVLKSLPAGLTEKAIRAARIIQFFPAEKDGRRVSQWVTLEYNFIIK